MTDTGATLAWSAQQQRLLRAMGFEPLRRVSSAAAPRIEQQPAAASTLRAEDAGGVRIALAGGLPTAGSADDRLLDAVLRAAGLGRRDVRLLSPESAAAAELRLPPLRQLAASVTARRALWPTLRKLRRLRIGSPR